MATKKRTKPKRMKTWLGWCAVQLSDGKHVSEAGVGEIKPAVIPGVERLARVRVTEIVEVKRGK